MRIGETQSLPGESSVELTARKRGAVCWPLVLLWLAAIAQYGYRYILQVNDPRSSRFYGPTPPYLSALKYAVFAFFAAYCIFRWGGRSISLTRRYRMLLWASAGVLLVLLGIFLLRLFVDPGAIDETIPCALQLMPWMVSAFLVPMVFQERHDAAETLVVFERLFFWMATPFWLLTVVLALKDVRYPNLTSPGLLLRFGGIIDDPNGYACLILLTAVLSAVGQRGWWRVRVGIYIFMVLATVSFAGYATALVIALVVLLMRWGASQSIWDMSWKRWLLYLAALTTLGLGLAILYQANEVVSQVSDLLAAKNTSADTHVSNLLPDPEMLEFDSPFSFLFGLGGFSENLYWRVLINFGWAGLLGFTALVATWVFSLWTQAPRWRRSFGAWTIGMLVGSNGIAYLLTFPVNLLFWSIAAMLLLRKRESAGTLPPG